MSSYMIENFTFLLFHFYTANSKVWENLYLISIRILTLNLEELEVKYLANRFIPSRLDKTPCALKMESCNCTGSSQVSHLFEPLVRFSTFVGRKPWWHSHLCGQSSLRAYSHVGRTSSCPRWP